MELVQLHSRLPEFKSRNLRLVAASVDRPDDAAKMRRAVLDAVTGEAKDASGMVFLSDTEGELLDLLGVRHLGAGPEGGDIAQSASFLFAADGTLLWHQLAENYRVRPHPEEILAAYDGAAD